MEYFILQLQLKFMAENTSEDHLLREGDISVEDNLERMGDRKQEFDGVE